METLSLSLDFCKGNPTMNIASNSQKSSDADFLSYINMYICISPNELLENSREAGENKIHSHSFDVTVIILLLWGGWDDGVVVGVLRGEMVGQQPL